jgi:hypothetical protein
MSNHASKSDLSKQGFELVISTVAALIFIPIGRFIVEQVTKGKTEIDFGLFKAPAESVRDLINELVLSVIVAVIIIQVARVLTKLGRAVPEYLSEKIAPVESMLKEFEHSITELSDGIVKATLRSKDIVLKFLRYDPPRGIIINALDATSNDSEFRNVLFDAKTITSIFSEIKQHQNGAKHAVPDRDSILFSLGKISGANFGKKMFGPSWRMRTEAEIFDKEDLHQWLIYWCRIDTEAGFGKFDVTPSALDWKKDPQMILKHSFLTEAVTGDHRLCEFMTGYIEGVIGQAPPRIFKSYNLERDRIRIGHRDGDECSFHSHDQYAGCTFRITMEQPSSGAAVVGRAAEKRR